MKGGTITGPGPITIEGGVWVTEEGGRYFKGNGRALRDRYAFGAVVRSATGGVVTSAR